MQMAHIEILSYSYLMVNVINIERDWGYWTGFQKNEKYTKTWSCHVIRFPKHVGPVVVPTVSLIFFTLCFIRILIKLLKFTSCNVILLLFYIYKFSRHKDHNIPNYDFKDLIKMPKYVAI